MYSRPCLAEPSPSQLLTIAQMGRQAVITIDEDLLVIDLPNAVLQILVPSSVSLNSAYNFPQRVDLNSNGGRVAVKDENWREFISYEEKSQWTLGGLQELAEISETREYTKYAVKDDFGIMRTAYTEPPARGRSPTSRVRNSGIATQLQGKSQSAKSQDALFTPEYSPQKDVDKPMSRDFPTAQPKTYRYGPPEVPIRNTGLKAMTARDRYNTPTPERGSSVSSTPGSRFSDRKIKDLGKIDPKKWVRQSVVAKRRRMSGSEPKAALFRFNSHDRVPGTQPLDTKYKGMAGYCQTTLGNTSEADESTVDNDTASNELCYKSSPTKQVLQKRNNEGTRPKTSHNITKNDTRRDGQPTNRIRPVSPQLPDNSSDTETQTFPITTKCSTQKADKLKRRQKITPPRVKGHSNANFQPDVATSKANRRTSEGIANTASAATSKCTIQKDDKSKNLGLKPLPLPKTEGKSPEKLRSATPITQPQRSKLAPNKERNSLPASKAPANQNHNQRDGGQSSNVFAMRKENKRPTASPITKEHPSSINQQHKFLAPASSKGLCASPISKTPKYRKKDVHYKHLICIGTMTIDGSNIDAPSPPLSRAKTIPSPMKGYYSKACQIQVSSPTTEQLQNPTNDSQNENHFAPKGKKRPAPTPSPTEEHHSKARQTQISMPGTEHAQIPTQDPRGEETSTAALVNRDGKKRSTPTPFPTKEQYPTSPRDWKSFLSFPSKDR
ncbi:MAG: hypothetical protein L6R41_002249 [Letrouitia leprolyta]|nr:MAG: hypothetical protein L6R41_002249 [Letrouitia leprolyta]